MCGLQYLQLPTMHLVTFYTTSCPKLVKSAKYDSSRRRNMERDLDDCVYIYSVLRGHVSKSCACPFSVLCVCRCAPSAAWLARRHVGCQAVLLLPLVSMSCFLNYVWRERTVAMILALACVAPPPAPAVAGLRCNRQPSLLKNQSHPCSCVCVCVRVCASVLKSMLVKICADH